jgi:N-methylhydantoinase A/oxoprolinase/acetone carboxylase beta subunit
MRAVLVPPRAGVLSAVGLVASPRRRELVRSWSGGADHAAIEAARHRLGAEAEALVGGGASVETALDCRYVGQSHEITVPSVDEFHAEHARRNGYAKPETQVEVIALRARATSPAPLAIADLAAPARGDVRGPEVVSESDCTVYVPAGWRTEDGALGTWILQRERGRA